MKSLRLLLALALASIFTVAVVRADDAKKEEKECHGMACCKKKGPDGKASCATEGHDCCCDTADEKAAPASKPAGCCAKAEAKGEKCSHGCCVEAAKDGNNCEKCKGSGKIEAKK